MKAQEATRDTPENILVNELISYPEVDYDRESELLYKLARQVITKLGNGRNAGELNNIILYHKREIGCKIYLCSTAAVTFIWRALVLRNRVGLSV